MPTENNTFHTANFSPIQTCLYLVSNCSNVEAKLYHSQCVKYRSVWRSDLHPQIVKTPETLKVKFKGIKKLKKERKHTYFIVTNTVL